MFLSIENGVGELGSGRDAETEPGGLRVESGLMAAGLGRMSWGIFRKAYGFWRGNVVELKI